MVIKGLLIAGAAGLLALPALAQDTPAHRPDSSAHSPLTVNPAPQTPAEKYGVAPPTTSRPAGIVSDAPAKPRGDASLSSAPTGARSDVVAVSPQAALAAGGRIEITASAPVPDTRENRAKYGAPMSATGRMTAARGN